MLRKIILVLVFIIYALVGLGQQIIQRFYDYVVPGSLIKSNTGSIYMSGIVNNPPILNYKGFLSKLDSIGHPIWTIGYDDTTNLYLYNIRKSKQLANGDFIHSMDIRDTLNNSSQMFMKTDSMGHIKSVRKFIFPQDAYAFDFAEDNDGNIVFAGQINYGYIGPYQDNRFFLFKTNTALNLLWCKQYTAFTDGHFGSIDVFNDGNYLLQGDYLDTTDYFGNPNDYGRLDVCVSKIDTSGTIIWAKLAGNPLFPNPWGVPDAVAHPCKAIVTNDGTIVNGFSCDWYASQFSGAKGDIMIQRIDSNGNEIGCHRYGDQTYGVERLRDIFNDNNGNLVFSSEQLLFKSNYSLNKEWIRYARPSVIIPGSFTGFFDFNEVKPSLYQAIALTETGPPSIGRGCFINTDTAGISGCNNQNIGLFFDQPETPGTFDITNRFTENWLACTDTVFNVNSLPITFADSLSCNSATFVTTHFNNSELKIYPNPFIDRINIEGLSENCEYKITTIESTLLKKGVLTKTNNYQLQLGELRFGFYILTIDFKGLRFNYKILKV